jgi:2'-hydroxyisoflavone reductase
MRILVLGGTAFLSRTVAEEAVRRGHDVTCACRGVSGPLAEGASLVVWDRSSEAPEELVEAAYDAVVDVSRTPSHVRRAVAALPDPHWVLVSTGNVYRDHGRRGVAAADLPLLDPITTDEDPASSPDAYGGMKVACEQLVREGTRSAMVVRAGLIVGPGDSSGRFAYWPQRLAAGGEVLAPESPEDPVQWVDVRDLAAWIVDAAEARATGVFDGTGPAVPRRRFLDEVAAGVGASPAYTWLPRDFLVEHEVAEWSGPRSVPLWISDPEWQGFMDHDVTPSLEAGLRIRTLAETARDTLAWLRATPDAAVTGLTLEEEAEVLAAWRARPGAPATT